MDKKRIVGIDRTIPYDLLEHTASLWCEFGDEDIVRKKLDFLINDKIPLYSSRKKVLTILSKIWIRVPDSIIPIRDQAAILFPSLSGKEHVWLHYGLVLIAYPFFRDVVYQITNKSDYSLQITSRDLFNSIKTSWGERSSIEKQVCRVPLTLADWNLLKKDGYHYQIIDKIKTERKDLQFFILNVLLTVEAKPLPIDQIAFHPLLFPFQITLSLDEIVRAKQFKTECMVGNRIFLYVEQQKESTLNKSNVKISPPHSIGKKKSN